ncbi:MFS transporter [Prauserella endophytica]|uniref:MFS transporter n=2 Tax=Prauserella endophytica TaxID=1592324 RepID=A0ABY2RVY8_9PSEU|nr:MFS transporter [Prauserella endophytica]
MPSSDHTTGMASWRAWCGLAAMTLALFTVSTDLTMLFIAQPAIGADLRPGVTEALWIVHVGEFLAASLAITMGRLGDRLGRKRLLVYGMTGYGAASLIAAYAPNVETLIGARALIGLSTAAITPSAIALLRSMFPDAGQFTRAFSILMAAFTAGMAFGPPLGGFLVDRFWWGAVFLACVPAAVILLAVAPWTLPEFRDDRRVRLDPLSIALSVIAVMGLIYGVQQASGGTVEAHHVAIALTGVAAGYAFIRRQRILAHPLLDLSLLGSREVRIALPAVFLVLVAFAGPDVLIAPFLQIGLELTAVQAGLVLFVPAAVTVPVTLVTPRLKRRLGSRAAMILSLAIAIVGLITAALSLLAAGKTTVLVVLIVGLVLVGAGAPVITLLSELLVASAPLQRSGSMGALRDLGSTLGSATGIALVGTVGALAYRNTLTTPTTLGNAEAEAAVDSPGAAVDVMAQLDGGTRETFLASVTESMGLSLQAGLGIAGVICLGVLLLIAVGVRDVPGTEPESLPTEAETA